MTPATPQDWPAVTLRLWRSRTGLSNASIARLLGHAGVSITGQGVQAWVSGECHLPARIVPLLMSIDPAAADVWHDALRAATGDDEPVTEDHVPLPARVLRALREGGESTSPLVDLLDGITESERRAAIAQLREDIAEKQRVLDHLAAMRVAS